MLVLAFDDHGVEDLLDVEELLMSLSTVLLIWESSWARFVLLTLRSTSTWFLQTLWLW